MTHSHVDKVKYMDLKKDVIEKINISPLKANIVESIKRKNRHQIGSIRMYERIQDPIQLIRILEKRMYLSPLHLEIFKDINSLLNGVYIENLLDSQSTEPGEDDPKMIQIKMLIAKEIGHGFRDLARYLQIPEAKLIDLDSLTLSNIINFEKRNLEILDLAEKSTNNKDIYLNKLCNALVKCRRMDLKNRITTIWDK